MLLDKTGAAGSIDSGKGKKHVFRLRKKSTAAVFSFEKKYQIFLASKRYILFLALKNVFVCCF